MAVVTDSKINDALTELAQTFRESYQAVADSAAAAQEHNIKFVQTMMGTGVEELKARIETARTTLSALAEQSERQQQAVDTLARETVSAYIELAYSPFAYYQKSVEAAQHAFSQLFQQPSA